MTNYTSEDLGGRSYDHIEKPPHYQGMFFEHEPAGGYDHIEKPPHYQEKEIEPLQYIIANDLDFLEGNIVKYVTRYTYKGGINDLVKARTYLQKLIEREEERNER